MQKIRVVKKRPGMGPTLGWITNSLEAYQGFVGGYIETVPLDGVPGALIICNEEGKLQGLRENVLNGGDVIVGPIVVARVSGEDFASLTEDDIAAAIVDLYRMPKHIWVEEVTVWGMDQIISPL